MLHKFFDSEYSLYKCVAFYLRYTEQSLYDSLTQKQILKIKNEITVCPYIAKFGAVNLNTLDQIERVLNVRVFIWTKKNQRDKLRLEWENSVCENAAPPVKHLNLFSTVFDSYTNVDLTNLAVVLNLEKFTKNFNYNPADNTRPWRKMRLFEAVTAELHPKLVGNAFFAKVLFYETKWGSNEFNLADIKKFYKMFQVGLQFWTSETHKKRHEKISRKVFDSYWSKKVVLILDNFDEHATIFTHCSLTYVIDVNCINLFGCCNKFCFFGSNDIQKLNAHQLQCRTETVVSYKQVKYTKPTNEMMVELFRDNIIPSVDYENMFFAVYDIGKSN